MKALIKLPNGTVYPSVIFAYKEDSWDSEVIVLTPDYAALTVAKCWQMSSPTGIIRLVFNFEADDESFVQNGKWKGFDWLVGNEDVLKKSIEGKELPEDIIKRCKELQSTLALKEWNEINDQKDIDGLLDLSFGFHDGVVKSITKAEDSTTVEIECWGCTVYLKFITVIESVCANFNFQTDCILEAYLEFGDGYLEFENGKICWGVDLFSSFETSGDPEFDFVAERLLWKIIVD